MSQRYFAQISPGLESTLRAELKALGARKLKLDEGGVHFEGTRKHLYRALQQSRLASRVFQTLVEGGAPQKDALFARTLQVNWRDFISAGAEPCPVAIRAHLSATEGFSGSGEVESVIWNALERSLRDYREVRPVAWSEGDPSTIRLLARLHRGRLSLRIDAAGELMHKRGWRRVEGSAPLRPTLAAAMLTLLEWRSSEPLYDPMCGSGTIPIEAARWVSGRSPRLRAQYACMSWPSFELATWERELQALNLTSSGGAPKLIPHLFASDLESEAISMTQTHLLAADEMVQVWAHDAREIEPPCETPGLILINPPYGLRVAEDDTLKLLLRRFAHEADRWRGWRLGLVFPRQLTPPQVSGLDAVELARFQHGGLPVWVWRYEPTSTD